MKVAARTDPGRVRQSNEDRVFADQEAGILIVADGMGGHAAGEVASDLAVRTISQLLEESLPPGALDAQAVIRLLRHAIDQANFAIQTRAAEDCALRGMGTTVAIAIARGEQLCLGHVGDSRVYLIADGQLRRLTQDHSLVSQMVRDGQITAEQARTHHLRNVITRSLGFEASAQPDLQVLRWSAGDCLVLCSDGLTNMLTDEEIAAEVRRPGASVASTCGRLIALANERGGSDNISVIVAQNA
jgi:protein phosphatase